MRLVEAPGSLRSIPTRRSLLPPPVGRSDPRWEESWRHLFAVYSPAMRRYVRSLMRRVLGDASDAAEVEDVVQDYLCACLEKGLLAKDAGEIRCFRAYLQTQLRRFTLDYVDRKLAAKRHPGKRLSDEGLADVADPAGDPSTVELDTGLVESAVGQCIERLRAGNTDYAEIVSDLLRRGGEPSPDLARRLGRDEAEMAVLRHRARKRFAALLADELRSLVRDADAFDALLTSLERWIP